MDSKFSSEKAKFYLCVAAAVVIAVVFFPGLIGALVEWFVAMIVWTVLFIFGASLAVYIAKVIFSKNVDWDIKVTY